MPSSALALVHSPMDVTTAAYAFSTSRHTKTGVLKLNKGWQFRDLMAAEDELNELGWEIVPQAQFHHIIGGDTFYALEYAG